MENGLAQNTGVFAALMAAVLLAGCNRPQPPPDRPVEVVPKATEAKAEALEQSAAAGNKSVAAADLIRRPEAQAIDPLGAQPLNDALTCLARTIYWEARSETSASMESVANVVMNRLGHEGFPNTVCAVVKQGNETGACQFSWWCDGRSDHAWEDAPYAIAKEIARRALNQQLADRTHGALFFHQRTVNPSWTTHYVKTAAVDDFVFYKPQTDD